MTPSHRARSFRNCRTLIFRDAGMVAITALMREMGQTYLDWCAAKLGGTGRCRVGDCWSRSPTPRKRPLTAIIAIKTTMAGH